MGTAIKDHVYQFLTVTLQIAITDCTQGAQGAGNAVRNLWPIGSENAISDRKRAHLNELQLWIINRDFQVLVTEFHPILHQSYHNMNAAPAGYEVMEHSGALGMWRDFLTYRQGGNLKSLMADLSAGRKTWCSHAQKVENIAPKPSGLFKRMC